MSMTRHVICLGKLIMIERHKMPVQDPNLRAKNFDEVSLGYTEDMAVEEAGRCLNCINKPCVSGCPVNINIPDFISKVKEKKFNDAYKIILKTSSLPAICGRVCPQENQCEKNCTMGIKYEPVAIGALERFVADICTELNLKTEENIKEEIRTEENKSDNSTSIKHGKRKVAVIGSGPSGLACASDLNKMGYDVNVYEAMHALGGVLVYGIPEFRLPKRIVNNEINNLKKSGVHFNTNVVIGKTLSLDDLFDIGYEAVFIGTGAGLPVFMGIKGENLKGVFSANEYLTRNNLMKAYDDDSDTPIMKAKNVAVIGGGNVAMDACRTALRLGAENVFCIYRRSEVELPARKEEIKHAKEEGVKFLFLTNPIEIISYDSNTNDSGINDGKNGCVKGLKCIKMKLGDPDEKGRKRPIAMDGTEFLIDVNLVIMALGTKPNPIIKSSNPNLKFNKNSGIIIDENGFTSCKGIYAGGDAVTGSATVISAMGAGKNAAKAIDLYLSFGVNKV